MNLKFLNYHSIYSARELRTDTEIRPETAQICFRVLFSDIDSLRAIKQYAIQYTLIMFTDEKAVTKYSWNNYCPFSRKEIIQHLKCAQKVVPGFSHYEVIPTKHSNCDCYKVVLTVENTPRIGHHYVLTWARFLYEAAFSLQLMDALRLSKRPEFRFISIANILNVVGNCYNRNWFPDFNTWHGIGKGDGEAFLTSEELHTRLFQCEELNDIYTARHIDVEWLPKLPGFEFDFWKSDEDFHNLRLNTYLEALKKLKKGYPYCN